LAYAQASLFSSGRNGSASPHIAAESSTGSVERVLVTEV